MALSNTAVPKYYGEFRDAVIRGEIPICREIEMEMHRIDDLIANPGVYYDDRAIDGFIKFCVFIFSMQAIPAANGIALIQ